jgi:hypothetical protein
MLVFGMPVHSWLLYLPFFLALDFLRQQTRPSRAVYLDWLGSALAAAQRGEALALPADFERRRVWCRGILFAFGIYGVALVFVPQARSLARALNRVPVVEWLYGVIDELYPAALQEPAHIVALGHPVDAYDLRHFLTMCLILSITTLFLHTGPGCGGFAYSSLIKPIRQAARRGSKKMNKRAILRLGIIFLFIHGGLWWIFSGFGSGDADLPGYWHVEVYPPSLMFMLSAWGFGYSFGMLVLARDVAGVEGTHARRASILEATD